MFASLFVEMKQSVIPTEAKDRLCVLVVLCTNGWVKSVKCKIIITSDTLKDLQCHPCISEASLK